MHKEIVYVIYITIIVLQNLSFSPEIKCGDLVERIKFDIHLQMMPELVIISKKKKTSERMLISS